MPTRVITSSVALIAFALAIGLGAFAGNSAATTIWRALVAMTACYVVGLLIGQAARSAMNEHIERYKKEHPIPELDVGFEHGEPVEDAAGGQTQDAGRDAAGQPA